MTDTARLEGWLGEIKAAMDAQPETTWTLAKFRIALPSARPEQSLIKIDNVTATGVCNVEAVRAMVDDQTGRVKVVATVADFDMRGVSDLIGRSWRICTGRIRRRWRSSSTRCTWWSMRATRPRGRPSSGSRLRHR